MITADQREALKARLQGTCDTVESALAHFDWGEGIDPDEAEDALLDGAEGVELCRGCGWWHTTPELDSEPEPGYCPDCRADPDQAGAV